MIMRTEEELVKVITQHARKVYEMSSREREATSVITLAGMLEVLVDIRTELVKLNERLPSQSAASREGGQ